jgi:hypothetical protein
VTGNTKELMNMHIMLTFDIPKQYESFRDQLHAKLDGIGYKAHPIVKNTWIRNFPVDDGMAGALVIPEAPKNELKDIAAELHMKAVFLLLISFDEPILIEA